MILLIRRSLKIGRAERSVVDRYTYYKNQGQACEIVTFEAENKFADEGISPLVIPINQFFYIIESMVRKKLSLFSDLFFGLVYSIILNRFLNKRFGDKSITRIEIHGVSTFFPLIFLDRPNIVIVLHSVKSELFSGSRWQIKNKMDKIILKAILGRRERIWCVSKAIQNDTVENFGVPHSKVAVQYNKINEQRIIKAAKSNHEFDKVSPFFVFVG